MSTSKIWLIWGSNSPILSEYSPFVWTSHWSDLIPDYVQQFMLVCLTKRGEDVCQKQLHLGIQWWFYTQWFSLCSCHITCSWFRFILKNITFHAYGYKVSSGFFGLSGTDTWFTSLSLMWSPWFPITELKQQLHINSEHATVDKLLLLVQRSRVPAVYDIQLVRFFGMVKVTPKLLITQWWHCRNKVTFLIYFGLHGEDTHFPTIPPTCGKHHRYICFQLNNFQAQTKVGLILQQADAVSHLAKRICITIYWKICSPLSTIHTSPQSPYVQLTVQYH